MSEECPRRPSTAFDVVAVAASAGGLEAVSALLGDLPADFPAAIVLVQHLEPRHRSVMAKILDHRTGLKVREARDGDRLEPGAVLVAAPDHHLLVNRDGTVSLTRTEPVHFVRPSADRLFESLADSHGGRAIAVVLTGSGSDGARGVEAVKERGGTVIAQDEATSEHFGMPSAAIRTRRVDHVLPLGAIAPTLVRLVNGGTAE